MSGWFCLADFLFSHVLAATVPEIRSVWTDTVLRARLANLLVADFLLLGPITVGISLQADPHLPKEPPRSGLPVASSANNDVLSGPASSTFLGQRGC